MDLLAPIVAILIVIAMLGACQVVVERRALVKQHSFLQEYLSRFGSFAEKSSHGIFDSRLYEWLTARASRAQEEMGSHGVLPEYRSQFSAYAHTDYPLVTSTLMEMWNGTADEDHIRACQDGIARRLGELDEDLDRTTSRFLNPLVWFREGVRLILALPIRIARRLRTGA